MASYIAHIVAITACMLLVLAFVAKPGLAGRIGVLERKNHDIPRPGLR